jgi:sugar (pentulose or hexulose) kinase
MKKGYVMALDVGGGSGRCLLLDPDSGRVWTAQQTLTHPVALSSFS